MTHKPQGHGKGTWGGGKRGGWALLVIWSSLPRPDRGVGRGPGAGGVTVQMVIRGWGREGLAMVGRAPPGAFPGCPRVTHT